MKYLKNKKEGKKIPKVSFVICTLNCKEYTERCVKSIRSQNYPQDKVEIVVVDSYSTDGTIEIAKEYGARVILTKIRGYMEGKGMPKSIGCESAKGDIVITIDSDNALVEKDWIKNMIHPLMNDKKIDYAICRMAIVKTDDIVNRYLSYVGTDPFAIYGSLDPQIRMGYVKLKDKKKYWVYHNSKNNFLITGGYYLAFKKSTLKKMGGYSRDVDVAYAFASRKRGANIAIPKNAHMHHLITKSYSDFMRKKIKWGKYYFLNADKKERSHNWSMGYFGRFGKINFAYQTIKSLILIPDTITGIKMALKYKDKTWLIHPLMTFSTVIAYGTAFIKAKLS